MLGVFNIESAETGYQFLPKYLRISDGLVLVEAMRYAIHQVNRQNFLQASIGYMIRDAKESRFPYSKHDDTPALMGLSPSQTSYFLLVNQQGNAPIVNSLTSSYSFDHVESSANDEPKDDSNLKLFRTVPSNELETRAIIDILKKLRFSYVAVISSNDVHTQEAVSRFKLKATENGICVAHSIWLSLKPTEAEYGRALTKISSKTNLRAVVLFTSFGETNGVLRAAEIFSELTFISGTNWPANTYTVGNSYKAAKGSIVLQFDDVYNEDFSRYFMSLRFNTTKYTWFAEFWSHIFNCSVPWKYRITRYHDDRAKCLGSETLNETVFDMRNAVVLPVINAVQTLACALKQGEITNKCNTSSPVCIQNITKTTMKYFGKQKCDLLDHSVVFNKLGFFNRDFKIFNFDGVDYRSVGRWVYNSSAEKSKLYLDVDKVVWRHNKLPASYCYVPCTFGQAVDRGADGTRCCFSCRNCSQMEIVKNGTCMACLPHHVPDRHRSECVPLPVVSVAEEAGCHGWIIKCTAIVGFVFSSIITVLFVRNKTPAIKLICHGTTIITLVGLQLVIGSSFIFLMKPDMFKCRLQELLAGFSLNSCYTPLMVKAARMSTLFNASPAISSPRNIKFYVLVALSVAFVQLLIGAMWLKDDSKFYVLMIDIENSTKTALICKYKPMNTTLNLLPSFIIMAVTGTFAYKTRKSASHSSEAFGICFAMCINSMLFAVFISTLFLLEAYVTTVFASTLMFAYFMLTIGLFTLAGLFMPNLLKIFQQRQRATKVSFEGNASVKVISLGHASLCGNDDASPLCQPQYCDRAVETEQPSVCYCDK